MINEKKDVMVASIENVEAIREFLSEWYSVADLYKTAANAGSVLLELVNIKQLSEDDVRHISRMMDQHVMMTELLSKFEEPKDIQL